MFDISVSTNDKKIEDLHCILNHCTVGKARDNLVRLRGWRVSKIHAEIKQDISGVFVEDKSEGYGTLVNGDKISSRYGPLKSNDVISIGNFELCIGWTGGDNDSNHDDMMTTVVGLKKDDATANYEDIIREEIANWRNYAHQELLRNMDLRRTDVADMDESVLRDNVRVMLEEIIDGLSEHLPEHLDKEALLTEVLHEAVGLGPLEALIADEDVTEIMVNRFDEIYIEKAGRLEKTRVSFSNDRAVLQAIERIVSPLGRRIDESSPMVDGRLKDGSRVNAIIPPLALRGPCITIRKFSTKKLTADDLAGFGALNQAMVKFLRICVQQKRNIIISGGTGSGKTTLLNVLSNFIPVDERVVTVEDAAELRLVQPHVVSLESRPPNMEGKGQITIRDLVRNCLRMRPDRIVVGECRGGEALDMLQAMNTGHDGSLTTAHANSPRDMLSRLEVMVMMAGMDLPIMAIREQVASAVDIVVQQSRFTDGSRRVTSITEITGVESGTIQMQEIFRFKQDGFDQSGRIKGFFTNTGYIPQFYEELRERGMDADMSLFD